MLGCYTYARRCDQVGKLRECIHCTTALKMGGLGVMPKKPAAGGLEFEFYTHDNGKIALVEVSQAGKGD